MRNEPRHIFFDLDGTLIGRSGDVRDDVWEALEKLRGSFSFSVCTGRPRAGVARRVARRLEPGGMHIFQNGGMIAAADGEPFAVAELDVADLERLATAARDASATIEFYTTEGVFTSRLDDDCREHARALGIDVEEADLFDVIGRTPVIRAHWIVREHQVSTVVSVVLDNSQLGLASSPVLPGMIFGSVTREDTSKGTAARRVAGELGFELRDAIGIGDAPGDRPLLEVVGHAYVVGNAPPELRAEYATLGHVDEDGVVSLLCELAEELPGTR